MKTLLLSENKIGNGGFQHLVNALKGNDVLETLDISFNYITSALYTNYHNGTARPDSLAVMLHNNSTLTTLNLNDHTEQKVEPLAKTVQENSALTEFRLNSLGRSTPESYHEL